MWVLVPTDEILFFARMNNMDVVNAENAGEIFHQRKVSKRKPPDAACFLRFSHLPGVAKRDFPVPFTTCGFHAAPLTGYSR
jgi:hypothetical protein